MAATTSSSASSSVELEGRGMEPFARADVSYYESPYDDNYVGTREERVKRGDAWYAFGAQGLASDLGGRRYYERCVEAYVVYDDTDNTLEQREGSACFSASSSSQHLNNNDAKSKQLNRRTSLERCRATSEQQTLFTRRISCRLKRHEDILETIRKDVPRSYGESLRLFDTVENREALTEVLLVVSAHRNDVGYTQGMNFVCALALAHMPKHKVFFFMIHIISLLPRRFFVHTGLDEVELFCTIVGKHAPLVKRHLGEGFERGIGYLLVQWFIPLFVHVVPIKTTVVLWNMLFDAGNRSKKVTENYLVLALHRIAFSLLEIHAGPLLSYHRRLVQARDEHLKTGKPCDGDEQLSRLGLQVERYSDMGFMQQLVRAATKDSHGVRLCELAREITIENEWLKERRLRQANVVKKSQSASAIQSWYRHQRDTAAALATATPCAGSEEMDEEARGASPIFFLLPSSSPGESSSNHAQGKKKEKEKASPGSFFACAGPRRKASQKKGMEKDIQAESNCTVS